MCFHITDDGLDSGEMYLTPSGCTAFGGSHSAIPERDLSHISECLVHPAARLEDAPGVNLWTPNVPERCTQCKQTPIRAARELLPRGYLILDAVRIQQHESSEVERWAERPQSSLSAVLR